MPFTVGFFQACAKALGVKVGEHRAAAAINELKRLKILREEGGYRSRRHGYRVALYALPRVVSSVRRKQPVKWWEHPLFGFADGEKSIKHLPKRLRQWKEPPEWQIPWLHEGRA